MPFSMGMSMALGAAASVPFIPSQLPNLRLWLKADAGLFQDIGTSTPAVANNDPVGHWVDQSGNNNGPTQGTGGNKPALILNAQNGLPVIRFNGTSSFMSSTMISTQPYTIIFAAKIAFTTTAFYVLFDGGVILEGMVNNQNTNKIDIYAGAEMQIAQTNGIWHTNAVVFNGASSKIFADSATPAITSNAGTGNTTATTIGSAPAATDPSNVDFGEILYYSGDQTANMSLILSYLRGRWATP